MSHFFDVRGDVDQVEQRTSARRTGDVVSAGDARFYGLQNSERKPSGIGRLREVQRITDAVDQQ